MRALYVKIARRLLVAVIIVVFFSVLLNYLHLWRTRTRVVEKQPQILSSEMTRSAEGIEYSEYNFEKSEGALRFKIHARQLLEVRMGKSLLEGIEAYDFNPDGSIHNEIRSKRAEYDRDRKLADFYGDVRLFLGKELELRTNSLHYDLNANVGTTPDALQFYTRDASGTARGARFDQKREALDLHSQVDLVLVQRNAAAGSPAAAGKIHVTSEGAYCSEMMHRFIFQGKARAESASASLSGDRIEAALSSDRRRVTALTSTGNAAYQSIDANETRDLSGDSMVFGIGPSGVLQRINIAGRATFSSLSPSEEQDLRGGEIGLEMDAATGSLTGIQSRNDVLFRMKHGSEQTLISGEQLDARLGAETKSLEGVHVSNRAKLSTESSDSSTNELEANEIRVSFREANGRSLYEKLRAEGSAKWRTAPKQDSGPARREPARTVEASLLEINYSSEGDYWESGSASGKVAISESSGDRSALAEVRRLTADSAEFRFFPQNKGPKELDAEGHVQTTYEKKTGSERSPVTEQFQTASEKLKGIFALKNGESVVESVAQWGSFSYKDASRFATAGRCDYDAEKKIMILTESPSITDEMGSTTGRRVEYDQEHDVLTVRGTVWSKLKANKGEGSFFESSSSSPPSIVTADEMQYWKAAGRTRYTGSVRMLSESQQLQSHVLELFGGERAEAQGEIYHLVFGKEASKPAAQAAGKPKAGNSPGSPMTVQSSSLKYAKEANTLAYSGDVIVHSADMSMTSQSLDAILDSDKRVERATARGKVLLHQGDRECKGDMAEWYLDPGKYVVHGEPAEVYDPGRGGRSYARQLTSFTADDTILLENR